MVYDEKLNYVGDSHWRQDYEFGEGEELKLERGGTLVQVEEQMEIVNQDLSELLNKRHKEKQGRAAAMANASPNSMGGRVQNFGTPSSSLKPKSLNALLTPSGHHGRAVLSTTSPFEERQLLNNGNQDSHENTRPTKRRKPNESIQTKSGYAQNLTGTMLTLASAKPSSTPTIKYEPFNKPTVTHKPKATIDLTLDDDTESTGSMPAERISKEDILEKRKERARAQKMKRRRSPPPKSTYASNLTGVALSLNRPTPMPSKKVTKKVAPPIQMDEYSDSSSSEDIERLVEVRRPASEPKRVVPKVKSASVRKTKTPRREPEELARPPLDVETSSKPSRLTDSPVGLESRSVPDRPVSSLRIKARPPRKMMMLMDRPSSGPSGNRKSVSKNGTKSNLNNSFSDNSEPAQSQATLCLEAYTRKQEENIQARLNGKIPRLNLDLGLDDMTSSSLLLDSPLDGGIDYQDIDRRLSQKSPPSELMESPPIQPLEPSSSATRNFVDDGMVGKLRNEAPVENEFEDWISDSEMMFEETPEIRNPSPSSRPNKNTQKNGPSKHSMPKSNTPPQPYTAESPPPNEPRPASIAPSQKISLLPTKPKGVFLDEKSSKDSSAQPLGLAEKPGSKALESARSSKTNILSKKAVPSPESERTTEPPKVSDSIRPQVSEILFRKGFARGNTVLPNGLSLQDLFQVSDDESDHIDPTRASKTDELLEQVVEVAKAVKTSPIATPTQVAQVMNMASLQPPKLNEKEARVELAQKAPMPSSKAVKERVNPEQQPAGLQSSIQAVKITDTDISLGSSLIKKSPKGSTSPPKISPEALQGPIAHFRSIVRSSSTNTPVLSVEERPPVADATSAVQPEPLINNPIGPPREGTVPDSVPLQEISSLPEPIAPAVTPRSNPIPDTRPSNGAGFRFVNDGGSTSQSADNGSGGDLVLSMAAMKNQPFKLTKPNPTIMSSRPPVPAFSASKNNVENEGKRRERRPVTETGPWSKESFDLFGEWGPLV